MTTIFNQVWLLLRSLMLTLCVFFGLSAQVSVMQSGDPVPRKPKNIILLVGDGFGMPQTALMQYRLKSGEPFYLDSFPVVGIQKTDSYSHVITDSGASATAMSTGVKTYNNAVGVGPDTLPRRNLFELSEIKGIHTGVVVTSSVINATPAGFVCHATYRGFSEDIALDYLDHDIDVIIGGGKDYFDHRYTDDRDLVIEMEAKGYQVETYFGKHIENKLNDTGDGKFLIFTSRRDPVQRNHGREYFPYAVDATLKFLEKKDTGFFVMAEAAQIDFAEHRTNGEYLIYELLDFHDAIRKAFEFAKSNGETLVLVTGDHECGGLYFEPGKPYHKPVFRFERNKHSPQLVPVFAFGPGAEIFQGLYDNTEIFFKIKELLDL